MDNTPDWVAYLIVWSGVGVALTVMIISAIREHLKDRDEDE